MQWQRVEQNGAEQTDLARNRGNPSQAARQDSLTAKTESRQQNHVRLSSPARRHRPDYDVDADVDEHTDSQGHGKRNANGNGNGSGNGNGNGNGKRDWLDDDAKERTTKRVTAFCIR